MEASGRTLASNFRRQGELQASEPTLVPNLTRRGEMKASERTLDPARIFELDGELSTPGRHSDAITELTRQNQLQANLQVRANLARLDDLFRCQGETSGRTLASGSMFKRQCARTQRLRNEIFKRQSALLYA